jgi:Lipocalin-like domain
MRFSIGAAEMLLSTTVVAVLLASGLDVREASAQSGSDSAAATAGRLVGAWDLLDWRTTDASGDVRFPYGEEAQGQVTYSADGRMSAHLMRPPENPADAPRQFLSYWGTFSVDAAAHTVTHHVIGSDQANWIGSEQVRGYVFEGDDRLVLSLGSNRLTWVRAR